MAPRGKVLHSGERNILLKIMTYFEEEKKKKKSITPFDYLSLKVAKLNVRKSDQKKDPPQPKSESGAYEPTATELMLLENEQKYQALLKPFDNIIKRTAEATGVSEHTLRRIKTEALNIMATLPEDPGTSSLPISAKVRLSTPERKPRKKPKKRLEIDDFMICSIRNIIEQYYSENKVPTLRKILEQAKREFNFPGQRGTLWRIITTQLGYKFKKRVRKSVSDNRNGNWESHVYMEDDEVMHYEEVASQNLY